MIKKEYLPAKTSKKISIIMIAFLVCMYIVENSSLIIAMGASIFNYILVPFLWIGAIVFAWSLPHVQIRTKIRHQNSIKGWAFIFAFIFLVISILVGIFVDNLGKSPYSHSVFGILLNILTVAPVIVGREYIRGYLISSLTEEENYIVFIGIALLMTILNISFKSIVKVDGLESGVKLIASSIAPDFSKNLFVTYIGFLGGAIPMIVYMGTIEAFQWLSPVLPDLRWITTALVGVMCPVFFMTAIQSIHAKESKLKVRDKEEEGVLSWIITSLLSISIIWFSAGVFPIYPSVIATGSMEPMIKPGDVILIKKVVGIEDINKLKVGDVMQFRRGSILITHRIIEIKEIENEGLQFQTKGDNNSGPDIDLVKPADVKGTVIKVVPKVGWPTLLVKSRNPAPEGVEF